MEDDPDLSASAPLELVADRAGRLDKALAADAATEGFSRSRLSALIAEGALRGADGEVVGEPGRKVKPGERFLLAPPPPLPATPAPEAISLEVVFEDAALIVVNKPAGMVVHPAPGAMTGTLVAALLHHCGDDLSGVGGVARPGIVHRIDKDTSGLLVVAKSDAAHAPLAAQFAAHSIERAYAALVWGGPSRADPRLAGLPATSFEPDGVTVIDAPLARSRADRKKMAIVAGGRRAVTRFRVMERFGPAERPMAALLECRLETGRTHQIRVHLAHVGHPLIGDPVYGRGRAGPEAATGFGRQALHAATLGFDHPLTGAPLRFDAPPPQDFDELVAELRRI